MAIAVDTFDLSLRSTETGQYLTANIYYVDGEGIRYELVAFTRAVERGRLASSIERSITLGISEVMEYFDQKKDMVFI